jgi:mRNA interferase MazF
MIYEPEAGDLIWTDLDPRTGREQGGRRPSLVISTRSFWQATGMAVICPITSKIRPFPSSTVLPSNSPIKGEILTGQVRSIDTSVRPFKFSGVKVPLETLAEVRAKLAVLVGIV